MQREQFESVDYINIVRIWNNVWSRPSRWYSIRFFYFTRNDLVTAPLKTWVLLQTYRLTLNQCTNIRPPPPPLPQVYIIVGKYRFIVTFVIIYKNNVSRFSASFHEFDQTFNSHKSHNSYARGWASLVGMWTLQNEIPKFGSKIWIMRMNWALTNLWLSR